MRTDIGLTAIVNITEVFPPLIFQGLIYQSDDKSDNLKGSECHNDQCEISDLPPLVIFLHEVHLVDANHYEQR